MTQGKDEIKAAGAIADVIRAGRLDGSLNFLRVVIAARQEILEYEGRK